MKSVVFHSSAKAELDAAMAYYEERRRGLGLALLASVEKATERIRLNPKQFSNYKNTGYRRCDLQRFPYSIFFLELHDSIWVAAIAHQKRRPDYWKNRAGP